MIKFISLLRPHQWLKNIFVFLPLFFDKKLLHIDYLVNAIWAFAAFSLAASAIYCLNDIMDIEADKRHPKKRLRPLASGKITKAQAYVIMVILILASLAIAGIAFESKNLLAIIAIYIVLNIGYCIRLKHIAIVDVFIIASGFCLRVAAGGVATDIWISQWIILQTFLLALFLAFAKRRDDVVLFNRDGSKARKNINRYNLEFLNNAISIVATMTMMCYIIWCVSEEVIARMGTNQLYITAVFALMGVMRYLQLTMVDNKSGSPTKILLKDRFIHFCVAGWVATFLVLIYL
jgi:4-hydroxybenzoate polyprenyltransferase